MVCLPSRGLGENGLWGIRREDLGEPSVDMGWRLGDQQCGVAVSIVPDVTHTPVHPTVPRALLDSHK